MKPINKIETVDRKGNNFLFEIAEEPLSIGKYNGIYYKIHEPKNSKGWKHFVFQILFIDNSRILIYMIDNQNIPELSGKGIVKSMIEKLSTVHKQTIVSSTNIDFLKVDGTEGRVPNVTQYWIKWSKKNSNIRYVKEEDRFYFNY